VIVVVELAIVVLVLVALFLAPLYAKQLVDREEERGEE